MKVILDKMVKIAQKLCVSPKWADVAAFRHIRIYEPDLGLDGSPTS
jgi:hypothetical protein